MWEEGNPLAASRYAASHLIRWRCLGWAFLPLTITGLTKATKKLPALPVWDSLAVANGKLFYTTQTGEVICLGE